jgi:hypothetical protein
MGKNREERGDRRENVFSRFPAFLAISPVFLTSRAG